MDQTILEFLSGFQPVTLTEAVRNMGPVEPLTLTTKLGRNTVECASDHCVFEVEEGARNLAPVGFSGDPAANINISTKKTPYSVMPPQIFLKDSITARELSETRMVGQNPINMTTGDRAAAANYLVATKQQGLVKLIDRRIEWLFAHTLRGAYSYVSSTGRTFSHDFGLPGALNINGAYWDKATNPGNPVHQLRTMAKYFRQINNQMEPDTIILGGKAGDAFQNNPHVEDWMKSAGYQNLQLRMSTTLGKGDSIPLAYLQGAEIYEYSSTYEDAAGAAQPYIEQDYVYLTNSSMWRLYYGAIYDFDAGGTPPVVVGKRFSKMKAADDGKSISIFVESHPLPILINNHCVIKCKVAE